MERKRAESSFLSMHVAVYGGSKGPERNGPALQRFPQPFLEEMFGV